MVKINLILEALKIVKYNIMIHASSTNSYNLIDEDLIISYWFGLYGLSENSKTILSLKAIVQIYKATPNNVVG